MRSKTVMTVLSMFLAAACVEGGGDAGNATIDESLIGSGPFGLHEVAAANPATAGVPSATALSPELIQAAVAQGSIPVENPATVTVGDGVTTTVTHYGYDGDGLLLPAPGDLPTAMHKVEASKTEPDKNTYLVLFGQTGADAHYDYGTHFLFQGHETGTTGYITRINLDADAAHRVTVMASADKNGAPLPLIDGSTWNPFAQRLLFTSESGAKGGVWQATLGFPSVVEDISGALGRGGYEGIQNDSAGNLWIVEDVGGPVSTAAPHAKVPNSFLYRFVPRRPDDLTQGKLQVLQVTSLASGQPISFHGPDLDTLSADVGDLHSYGKVFTTRWVTIHDTAVDGSTPFDANALAKAKLGTPFKRPENAQFRPGTGFKELFFDETGDTSAVTEAGSAFGGFGGVFKLTQHSPGAETGTLALFYLGDVVHTAFDNVAFLSKNRIVFVEDRGDGLHKQQNALDSAWVLDVTADYSQPGTQPVRIIAEGRDPSATLDNQFAGMPGFQNEGNNELTGIHMSNGDPSRNGILGAAIPRPFRNGWRLFYTAQHGDNVTWEILPAPTAPPLLAD
jgi:hypothetical protein